MNIYTEIKSKSNQNQTIFLKKRYREQFEELSEAAITVLTDSWMKDERDRLPMTLKENKPTLGMLCPLKRICSFCLDSLN